MGQQPLPSTSWLSCSILRISKCCLFELQKWRVFSFTVWLDAIGTYTYFFVQKNSSYLCICCGMCLFMFFLNYMLIFTALWTNSADDKPMIFFPENRFWHFMQIVSLFSCKNEENIANIICWNFYQACWAFIFLILYSDDRSAEVFKTKIESSTQMKAVLGADPKPNCLVIDEIDGAPQVSFTLFCTRHWDKNVWPLMWCAPQVSSTLFCTRHWDKNVWPMMWCALQVSFTLVCTGHWDKNVWPLMSCAPQVSSTLFCTRHWDNNVWPLMWYALQVSSTLFSTKHWDKYVWSWRRHKMSKPIFWEK